MWSFRFQSKFDKGKAKSRHNKNTRDTNVYAKKVFFTPFKKKKDKRNKLYKKQANNTMNGMCD